VQTGTIPFATLVRAHQVDSLMRRNAPRVCVCITFGWHRNCAIHQAMPAWQSFARIPHDVAQALQSIRHSHKWSIPC